MAFNSIEYLIFLLVVVLVHLALPLKWRLAWVLLASYYFYAQWNDKYLLLIMTTTALDYIIARWMSDVPRQRKMLLAFSIVSNLGVLFLFKYYGFFTETAQRICEALGRPLYLPAIEVLLPAGISFYTLQTMSYTIDVYKRNLQPEKNLIKFATYVAAFPQLVAGPIERARDILPQLGRAFKLNERDVVLGVRLIAWGLFKKVVIADRLLQFVDYAFQQHPNPNNVTMALAGFWANILIYADFSAYADIAVGSGLLIGLKFSRNFNFPLFSRSMPDFWKRWHISLHTWFLDYVYYPLGGSRVGHWRMLFNVFLIFILSGLWHGAAWNFVIWSMFHLSLVYIHLHVFKFWRFMGWPMLQGTGALFIQVPLVHLQRALSMFLFFIPDVGKCFDVYGHFLTGSWQVNWKELMPFHAFNFLTAVAFTIMLFAVEILHLRKNWTCRLDEMPVWRRWMCYYAVLFLIMVFGIETDNPFIYFQF